MLPMKNTAQVLSENRKPSERLYKWTEFDYSSELFFSNFCPVTCNTLAAKGLMGGNILLKQCPARTGPLRDTSRQIPSCKLSGCCTGLDIKLCGLQNRAMILDMSVGTLLGTANLINTTGRKSPGVSDNPLSQWQVSWIFLRPGFRCLHVTKYQFRPLNPS